MRIAILGGSFDPIHNGHLQIAKTALKKLPIDELWFMPTSDTPLKQGQSASFKQRKEMIYRSIRAYRHMKLSTIENERTTPSYTIDTVKELQHRYPNDTFCWLIGEDQAQKFALWKDSETLQKLISFYVFSRKTKTSTIQPLPHGFKRITMELVDVSSSQIRAGLHLSMVPVAVLNVMGKEGLYIAEIVRNKMSEKRFIHSCSVAHLCVELAIAHHLDIQKAYIMGITHDICKEMPKAQAQIWMKYHMPDKLSEASAIWHGYIGADYLHKILHIHDVDILASVHHHVKGRGKSDYDRILFIADKLDPSRGYDSSAEIALAMQNLKQGFALVKQQQRAYLKQEHKL